MNLFGGEGRGGDGRGRGREGRGGEGRGGEGRGGEGRGRGWEGGRGREGGREGGRDRLLLELITIRDNIIMDCGDLFFRRQDTSLKGQMTVLANAYEGSTNCHSKVNNYHNSNFVCRECIRYAIGAVHSTNFTCMPT